MSSRIASSVVVLLLVLFSSASIAQPPDILWTQEYGEDYGTDYGEHVVQTADGGSVMLASVEYVQPWNGQMALIKYEGDGDELWVQEFGEDGHDLGTCLAKTDDGGFILVGYAWYNSGSYTWLIKTDADGNEEWTQSFGDNQDEDDDVGSWVEQTSDGGYIVTGVTDSGLFPNSLWLLKTDAAGNQLWGRSYGDNHNQTGLCVKELDDGYIVLGTHGNQDSILDIWLIRTDLDGNEIWNHTYGQEDYHEYAPELVCTPDGNFVVVGKSTPANGGGSTLLFMKTDADGNLCWSHTDYTGGDFLAGTSVRPMADGGFIICGEINVGYPSEIDLLVMKTDAGGNLIWYTIAGRSQSDGGACIEVTDDNGFVVTGYTVDRVYPHMPNAFLARFASVNLLPVTISLSPHDLPIQIPAQGGSFFYDALLMNTLAAPLVGHIWAVVELPNGQSYFGPQLPRTNFTFTPGVSHSITDIEQVVPSYAPAGTYTYKASVGFFPNDMYAQDSFEFEKLAD